MLTHRGFYNLTRARLWRYTIYVNNHTSKSQLKVDGKMSESGADRVGLLQGVAYIIIALSVLITAVGGVLWLLK